MSAAPKSWRKSLRIGDEAAVLNQSVCQDIVAIGTVSHLASTTIRVKFGNNNIRFRVKDGCSVETVGGVYHYLIAPVAEEHRAEIDRRSRALTESRERERAKSSRISACEPISTADAAFFITTLDGEIDRVFAKTKRAIRDALGRLSELADDINKLQTDSDSIQHACLLNAVDMGDLNANMVKLHALLDARGMAVGAMPGLADVAAAVADSKDVGE